MQSGVARPATHARPDGDGPAPVKVHPGDPLYNEVLDFLNEEAEMLDDDRLVDWLAMLAEDVSYLMPVRVTRQRGEGSGFAPGATFFDDDKTRLTFRVRRIVESPNAHAERPATRTRRLVTNVRIRRAGADLLAQSSLLLLRSRWDQSDFDLLSARRNDLLRRVGADLKLVRREILVDQTVPESLCLTVFL